MKGILKHTALLATITIIAGLALGLVHEITLDPIAQAKEKQKQEAYKAVFAEADQFENVDFVAGLFYQVHHVEGDDNRDSKLHQLSRKIQVALKVCRVDNVQDCVGPLAHQIVSRDDFFQCVRRKRINAGKVGHDDAVMLF